MTATWPGVPRPRFVAIFEVPTSDETAVPKDDDGESWLELLRDGLDASVGKNLGKKNMGKLGKPWT